MNRRLLGFVLAALVLVAIAAWLRVRDGAELRSGWRPPRVTTGRDQRERGPGEPSEGPDWGAISCVVESSVGTDPGRLLARNDEGETKTARVEDRTLSLELEPGEWTLSWHSGAKVRPAELRRLGLVEVEAGEVRTCTIPARGWTLTGGVRDLHGEPLEGELVEGCGASTHTDEAGRFSLVLSRGDCLVRAWALDGMLRRPSEPVYFSPFDVPAPPSFRVDTAEIGGVGLGLVGTGHGLRVSLAVEGGPGAAAGIEPGDLVVAVNDASVAGWTVETGVEAITGPPGTLVRLRVKRGEAEQSYALVRARIEEDAVGEGADTGRTAEP